MSDDIDYAEPVTRKRAVQRERDGFQPIAVAFLRRVLVPPCFVTAIIGESELTQNARARAKQRGFVSGFPDLICFQHHRAIGFELKWGTNKPSDAQLYVQRELNKCGVMVYMCWSINDIHNGLIEDEFSILANGYTLAREFDERALAAVRRAEMRAQKPHSKQRTERPTQSRIRRMHATGIWDKP